MKKKLSSDYAQTLTRAKHICHFGVFHLGAVVAGGARIDLNEPRLVLVVHHEVVAVQLPGLLAVLHQVLRS